MTATLPRPRGDATVVRGLVGDLLRWADAIQATGRSWTTDIARLRWTGQAADLARARARSMAGAGETIARAAGSAAAALADLALALEQASDAGDRATAEIATAEKRWHRLAEQASRADAVARATTAAVAHDPSLAASAARAVDTAWMARQAASRAHRHWTDVAIDSRRRLQALCDTVESADRRAAAALTSIPATTLTGPTPDLPTLRAPEWPSWNDSYADTRHRIRVHLYGLVRRRVELLETLDSPWSHPLSRLNGPGRYQLEDDLDRLDARISLHRGLLGRQILEWDPEGDGRVVEVLGDLDAAHHVAVVVPGITNTIDNYEIGLRPRAAAIYDEAGGEDGDIAVIAWLGYDTPGVLDAVSKRAAHRGADELARLLRRLDRDQHVSVVAHSYGTVVSATAATTYLDADEWILLGSPGVPLPSAHAARLREDGEVWVMLADDDPVGGVHLGSFTCSIIEVVATTGVCVVDDDGDVLTGFHGPNPAYDGFGAIELDPRDARGHSSYLDAGSQSLAAIVDVITR